MVISTKKETYSRGGGTVCIRYATLLLFLAEPNSLQDLNSPTRELKIAPAGKTLALKVKDPPAVQETHEAWIES